MNNTGVLPLDHLAIHAEIELKVDFYDVDSMQIVWHGNYVKYMEQARCALLDRIGYNYNEMAKGGFAWPVVDIHLKYVRPLVFNQIFRIRATLVDWDNRIKIDYLISDPLSGQKITTGHSIQMAVDIATGESLFATPKIALDHIAAYRATLEAGS